MVLTVLMAWQMSPWSELTTAYADEIKSAVETTQDQTATTQTETTPTLTTQATATYAVTFVVDSDEGSYQDPSLVTTTEQADATLVDDKVAVEQGATLDATQIPAVSAADGTTFDKWVEYDTDGTTVKATYTADELAQTAIGSDVTLKAAFKANESAAASSATSTDQSASSTATPSSSAPVSVSTQGEITPQATNTYSVTGLNDAATVTSGATFDMMNGIGLTVTDSTGAVVSNYSIKITGVTSSGSYTWNGTDTTFTAGANGTTYTITYGIFDANGNPVSTGSTYTQKVTVIDASKVIDTLTTDDQYVSGAKVSNYATGTAAFDADDTAGNDSSASNMIVRTYDNVTYNLSLATASYTQGNYYAKGYVHYKVVLPYTASEAGFDTAAMGWMTTGTGTDYDYKVVTENINGTDCQVLYCTQYIDATANNQTTAFPASALSTFVTIKVKSMKNGDTVQPKIYTWMDHNDIETGATATPTEQCPEHTAAANGGHEFVEVPVQPVTVSAAPRYNVALTQSSNTNAVSTFDFANTGNSLALNKSAGSVYGRILNYGVTLQLYNNDTSKGLKGVEFPTGPITFKVTFAEQYTTDSGTVYPLDISGTQSAYSPLVWSYQGNSVNSTKADGRDVASYGVGYCDLAPVNKLTTPAPFPSTGGSSYCWDGGTWGAAQTGATASFTVDDYTINPDYFPNVSASGGLTYYDLASGMSNTHIGCFSAGEVYVVVPFGGTNSSSSDYLANKYGNGTIQLTVKDVSLAATSASGQKLTTVSDNSNQMNPGIGVTGQAADDQAVQTVYLTQPGSFSNVDAYTSSSNGGSDWSGTGSAWSNGKDVSAVGQSSNIIWGGINNRNGDNANGIYAMQSLMKFDDTALEITGDPAISTNVNMPSGWSATWLYAAKSDKSGWTDDAEMNAATETGTTTTGSHLVYFSSLSELQNAGYTCVGILSQLRRPSYSTVQSSDYDWTYVPMKVKDDYSLAGHVAQTCVSTTYWTEAAYKAAGSNVPSRLDVQNGTATMPAATATDVRADYVKATYDSVGNYTGGHVGDINIGDSLYITPYKPAISKFVANTLADGTTKTNYYVDNGSYYVDFRLTPSLTTYAPITGKMTTTLTVVDRIPDGTSYVAGSAYYGGTYTSSGTGASSQGNYRGTVTGGTAVTPTIGTDADGHTTLTFTFDNVEVGSDIGDIYFTLQVDKSLITSGATKQFTNGCYLETSEYKPNLTLDANGNYVTATGDAANAGFSATKTSALALVKKADKLYNDTSEPMGFTLSFQNNGPSNMSSQIMLDTLPVTGALGSSFSGTYSVTGYSITKLPAGKTYADYKVYYTADSMAETDSKTGLPSVKGASSFTTAGIEASWTQATIGTDGTVTGIPENATAIAILGDLPATSSVESNITLTPNGAKSNDVFVNKLSTTDGEGTGTAYIDSRNVSGITWIDANKNGQIDTTEDKLSGVTATLVKKADYATATGDIANIKNYAVTNLDGTTCQTTTNSNGYYSFTNLSAGDYVVVFTSTTGGTQLGSFTPTTTDASGVADAVNSKATGTTDGTTLSFADVGNTTDPITLPASKDITTNPYWDNYNNAGFYISDPSKAYDANSDVTSEATSVTTGTTITYAVNWANTTGSAKDITVTDTPSTGLTFNNDAVYSGLVTTGIAQDPTATFDGDGTKAVTWTIPAAPAGATGTITYSMTVNKSALNTVNNHMKQEYANSTTTYEKTLTNPSPTKTYDAATAAGADGAQVKVGDVITYDVNYDNTSDAAQTVTITDTPSDGLTYNKDAADSNGAAIADTTGTTWTFTAAAKTAGHVTYSCTVNDKALATDAVNNAATIKVGDGNTVTLTQLKNPLSEKVYSENTASGANNDLVKVGDVITYRVKYNNTYATDKSITIVDTMSTGLTYNKDAADSNGVTIDGKDGTTWTFTAKAGTSGYVEYSATVDSSAVTKVDNTATLAYGDEAAIQLADLVNPLTGKTYADTTAAGKDGSQVKVGDVITYQIAYGNENSAAQTVTIVDTPSAGLTYNGDVKDSNGATITASGTTWTFSAAAHTTGIVTYSCTVGADALTTDSVTNSATIKVGNGATVTLPKLTNPLSEKVYSPSTKAGADGDQVKAGDVITYRVKYNNTYAEAKTIKIVDTMSTGLTYNKDAKDSNGATITADGTTWTFTAAAGTSGYVEYSATVNSDAAKQVDNTATLAYGDDAATQLADLVNPVPTAPVKDVTTPEDTTTSIDGSTAQPDQVLSYKIVYTNTTGKDVTAAITDAIPEHTTYVDGSADNGGTYANGVVSWSVDVKNGDSITVTFKVKVDTDASDISVENTAKVNDGRNTYDTNTTINPVGPHVPAVTLHKDVDKTVASQGDQLTYTITATNSGTGISRDYVVTDVLSGDVSYVSSDGTYDSTVAGKESVSWTFDTIEPGETKTMTVTVKVKECSDGTQVPNTVTGKGSNTPPTTSNTVVTKINVPHGFLPKTGDPSSTMLYALLACAGIVAVLLGRRRRMS